MKVVILAGGYGTRISEETEAKPKPMVEIGSRPILWHIMKIYSQYGYNDFIICIGYKGYLIKEYFANYFLHQSDVTIELSTNNITSHNSYSEPWKVTLVDTGVDTMTGGRIRRIEKYLDGKPFLLTYGDGVADLNINDLVQFHRKQNTLATLTAVQLDTRYGKIDVDTSSRVTTFLEKPKEDSGWVNGGFMVCEPKIMDYIPAESNSVFERAPLEKLAKDGQLAAYRHRGFWQCMDTLREKQLLEKLWTNQQAPWKVW